MRRYMGHRGMVAPAPVWLGGPQDIESWTNLTHGTGNSP